MASQELNTAMERTRLWWLATATGVVGLAVSGYLTWIKLTGSLAVCAGIGDCETVNSSRFAEVGGIPIALIGVLGYLAILFILYLLVRKPAWRDILRLTLFGFTLTGTLYSLYLTYLEIFVLRAICPYCVISALAMISLFLIALVMLRQIFQVES
jgi:uncharacterized membrane protein